MKVRERDSTGEEDIRWRILARSSYLFLVLVEAGFPGLKPLSLGGLNLISTFVSFLVGQYIRVVLKNEYVGFAN